MSKTILATDNGAWAEITLNRPDRMNAFNQDMHVELRAALERFSQKRAILLTGAGRGFCAGQDLGDRDPRQMQNAPDLGETVENFWAPLVRQIRALEMPVICSVNGAAAGAGSSLALNCDIVLAAESARFIQSFAAVGLIPDTGGSWHLPRLIGPARARGLAMTGEPISAQKALEWGLIWQVHPDQTLMDEARALTSKLAAGPTLGIASTKKAIDAALTNSLDEQLRLETQLMRTCGRSSDYAEGVTAFLEKRKPEFSGK